MDDARKVAIYKTALPYLDIDDVVNKHKKNYNRKLATQRMVEEIILRLITAFGESEEGSWIKQNDIDVQWAYEYNYAIDNIIVGCTATITEEQQVLFAMTFGKAMQDAFTTQ